MRIARLILLLALPWYVYQYDTNRGEPSIVFEGAHETRREARYGWVYFEAPRKCYTLTATFPGGETETVRTTSECGAFLPVVVAP